MIEFILVAACVEGLICTRHTDIPLGERGRISDKSF